MDKTVQDTIDIQRIGTNTISDKVLYKSIYKKLSVKQKVNKSVTPEYIEQHTTHKEMIYHPIWMIKNMVVAGRPPFPPKKIPRVIFVDAVSGYRGLFSHVPHLINAQADDSQMVEPVIDEASLDKYISDVRTKQINRSYMLKKPDHTLEGTSLTYLPLWKVTVASDFINHVFYINANTGEDEQFMSDRWKSRKDLIQ